MQQKRIIYKYFVLAIPILWSEFYTCAVNQMWQLSETFLHCGNYTIHSLSLVPAHIDSNIAN